MQQWQRNLVRLRNSNRPHSIKSYLERVQLYIDANVVAQVKQVAILLSSIGATTYFLLSDLMAPDAPSTKSLAEISVILRKHYEPKRAVIAERFYFYKRDQAAGESIADFDAALRKLAIHCDFGANLPDTPRDRLVCGLNQEAMQRRLLSEKKLTYDKAMEAADRNLKGFKGADVAVHKVTERSFNSRDQHSDRHSSNSRESSRCFRCGRGNHGEAECKFREATCHRCGKVGHIAPVCRSKSTKFDHQSDHQDSAPSTRTNRITLMEDVVDEDNVAKEYLLF